jgi:tetratricopeptide (TPR) repeat protein
VVSGYLKMGDVLGRARRANLGNPNEAMARYRMAWAMLDRLGGWRDTHDASLLWILIGDRIALLAINELGSETALATIRKTLPEAQRMAARYPLDSEVAVRLADLYQAWSDAEVTRSSKTGVEYARKAIGIYQQLLRRDPRSEEVLENLGSSYSQLAYALSIANNREEALYYARKSLETREERTRLHPEDAQMRRDLMVSYTRVGDMLGGPFSQGGGGDEKAAYEYYRRAGSLAEALAKGDPNSHEAQDNYAIVLARIGGSIPEPDAAGDKLRILGQAAGMLEESLRLNPKTRINRITLCIVFESMAERLEQSGRLEEALERAKSERKTAGDLMAEQPDYKPAQYRIMISSDAAARLLAKLGRRDEALAAAREMLRVVSKFQPDSPMNWFFVARSWACLGNVYRILADRPAAREAYQHARDAWQKLVGIKGPFDAAGELAKTEARLREGE